MNFVRPSRRALLGAGGLVLLAGCAVESRPGPSSPAAASPTDATTGNPSDALYDPGFRLSPLSADPIDTTTRPERSTGLSDALIGPTYGTHLYRAIAVTGGEGGRIQHEYSRRQVFNAGASRYLAQNGKGL